MNKIEADKKTAFILRTLIPPSGSQTVVVAVLTA